LVDFDGLFVLRLTIVPMLYKYMRIYLWTISSRCLTALRNKFFRQGGQKTKLATKAQRHKGEAKINHRFHGSTELAEV